MLKRLCNMCVLCSTFFMIQVLYLYLLGPLNIQDSLLSRICRLMNGVECSASFTLHWFIFPLIKHNVSYIKANKGTKICSFYPIYFFLSNRTFWCIWSHLDPSNHFWGRWDPGDQIRTQGTFSTKFQILHFALKTQQYGCLGTRLDPSNQLLSDLDPRGQIMCPKSLWPQIQKSAL